MRPFLGRITLCVLPVLVAALIVGRAVGRYEKGEGGFKLGVDLVGGTILVYEVDPDRLTPGQSAAPTTPGGKRETGVDSAELAEKLKRRIDPADLYNVTIRPVGKNRVEIILPTGGAHQSAIEEAAWQGVVKQVRDKYLGGDEKVDLEIDRGRTRELVFKVQQEAEARAWRELREKLAQTYPKLKDVKLDDVPTGDKAELVKRGETAGVPKADLEKFVQDTYQPPGGADIEAFVTSIYNPGNQRRDVTGEEVQRIKDLIKAAGSLAFQILANSTDDKEAVEAAREYFVEANKDTDEGRKRKAILEQAARAGLSPPAPAASSEGFTTKAGGDRPARYAWVELGRSERKSLSLNNGEEAGGGAFWKEVAGARAQGLTYPDMRNGTLLYSRPCVNGKLSEEERREKKYDYFLLTRASDQVAVDGKRVTISATSDFDEKLNPAVKFTFNSTGGRDFYEMTYNNRPTGPFHRHLAIILDGLIVSAPSLRQAISTNGQITGNFTQKEVNDLVSILRSGALPATLKPLPVSENTIGPTLGQDTIVRGTRAVGLSFAAILLFMLVYYRFAGVVACVALFANLLLTVGFMVGVNATFTLPGLAGLVLMLGMAVDANVLIYERLREERDRGASLALAIRNGYDRAFPTIIDTHLSSIFTAVVLYAVGNDQLKGFGVSLTAGLIISLFTSLVMTRLMFDLWLAKGWLRRLSMLRLLSRTSIDFMRVRYYWFTATILLTVFGITVFVLRGNSGLNVDFVGGTTYTGQLNEPRPISGTSPLGLRQLLGPDRQATMLVVSKVEQLDPRGHDYRITYDDGMQQQVSLANAPPSDAQAAYEAKDRELQAAKDDADKARLGAELAPLAAQVKADREKNVLERASKLPDVSVEQIILASDQTTNPPPPGTSRVFNVRTTEKAPELVQVSLYRLLREEKDGRPQSLLQQVTMQYKKVSDTQYQLTFSDYASPGYVKMLLERDFARLGGASAATADAFDLAGEGKGSEGRYKVMRLDVRGVEPAQVQSVEQIVKDTQEAFAARPQPERLENFDAQLASETRTRAMYAIVASWAAILLYLWFRFGSWTFGLATVMCLIHDLFFTLGIIAFCHYITVWVPGLASFLMVEDFKIDLPTVAALLTLVGYSVNDTIVVFDRIREVRGKNPNLTPQMINDSVNQTLSRTLLTAFTVFLVVAVLYVFGGEGVHLFAFVMVVGVIVGTYSSIYIASPLLLIFGEGNPSPTLRDRRPQPSSVGA